MLILNQDTMYIHIPKTSGTNFRRVLEESSNQIVNYNEVRKIKKLSVKARDIFWLGRDISDIKEHPFLQLSEVDFLTTNHAPVWVWQKSGDWNHHKIITIVRNPYTRAVSLYKQIIRLFGVIIDQNLSFQDFLNHSIIQSVVDRFPHSYKTQQIDYLKDITGNVKVDKVYKIETDMNELAQTYNLKDLNTFKYNSGNYEKDYSKIYDDFLVDWVRTTYKDDFEFFEYDKTPFWM